MKKTLTINKKMEKEKLFSIQHNDFKIEFFRAGGHGGQNVNKRDTACRITHIESGAVGVARDERSQAQNKKLAFQRCISTKKFQNWMKIKAACIITGKDSIEKMINEKMSEDNLKIELEITFHCDFAGCKNKITIFYSDGEVPPEAPIGWKFMSGKHICNKCINKENKNEQNG